MKAVFLCDFDGTAMVPNITVEILNTFAGEGWLKYEEEWLRGERGGAGLGRLQFSLVKAPQDEISAFALQKADFRRGFHQLVHACKAWSVEFAILTSGLTFYVREILAAGGLSDVEVWGEAIEPGSGAPKVIEGTRLEGCPNGGTCKCGIIQGYRAQGYLVVFAGDGSRDFCAAPQADLLFARRKLKEFAESHYINYKPFENFFEVAENLESWLTARTLSHPALCQVELQSTC